VGIVEDVLKKSIPILGKDQMKNLINFGTIAPNQFQFDLGMQLTQMGHPVL